MQNGKARKGIVEYFLNERVEQGTAKLLRGNPELTKALILNNQNTHKYTAGSIVLEEKISNAQKNELMDEFQRTLMSGIEGRYNILWVEHSDKGKTELNFVIPRLLLDTGKSFNPYWDHSDRNRVNAFRDWQNLKHGYSDPLSPEKERLIKFTGKYKTIQQELHIAILEEIQEGLITNQAELFEFLEENQIEVTRQVKQSISVKIPGVKKTIRLRGMFYEQRDAQRPFSADEDEKRRAIEEYRRGREEATLETIEQFRDKHERYISKKAEFNISKYRIPDTTRERKIESGTGRAGQETSPLALVHGRDSSVADHDALSATSIREATIEAADFDGSDRRVSKVDSAEDVSLSGEWSILHHDRHLFIEHPSQQKKQRYILYQSGGIDDRNRDAI